MANPFDSEDGFFRVLVNNAGEHCLWPEFAEVPSGWTSVCGPTDRAECLRYVEANWTDPRPRQPVGTR